MTDSEIVFSCVSCRKPLMVSGRLSGDRVRCPLCGEKIRVPKVKTGILRGRRDSPASIVSRQMREIRRLHDRLAILNESFESLERSAPETEENLNQLIAASRLMQRELGFIHEHAVPHARDEDAVAETSTSVRQEKPEGAGMLCWIGYGLAALFALLIFFV